MTSQQLSWKAAPSRRFTLRCLGFALLAVYLGWNLFELSLRHIPSSLLVAFTGLPCPTTGGTRAMLALSRGELAESLRFNPLAVPFTVLGCLTIARLGVDFLAMGRLRLSDAWLHCWLVLLAVGWIIQLTMHFAA